MLSGENHFIRNRKREKIKVLKKRMHNLSALKQRTNRSFTDPVTCTIKLVGFCDYVMFNTWENAFRSVTQNPKSGNRVLMENKNFHYFWTCFSIFFLFFFPKNKVVIFIQNYSCSSTVERKRFIERHWSSHQINPE